MKNEGDTVIVKDEALGNFQAVIEMVDTDRTDCYRVVALTGVFAGTSLRVGNDDIA